MISKVAAGGGAAALTAFAIGVSLRHGILVAGARLRRRLRQSRHHRQRDAQHARPVRLSAGDRRRHAGRHPRPRLVAARLGRARGLGDLDGGLDAVRRRADCTGSACSWWRCAGLFVWATWRRMGESENPPADVAALVWAALGLTGVLLVAVIVQDDGRQNAGWLALAAHGAGLFALGRWTPRFQYVAALAPVLSIAALAAVVGRARAAWERHGTPIASPGSRSCWAASMPRRPSRCCGTRRGRDFGRRSSVAAALAHFPALLVRAALRGDRHAMGPDQHRPCRAVPGRRRAAGALARNA